MLEIPLNNAYSQEFSIVIEGTKYILNVYANSREQKWYLTILNSSKIPLVEGVALVGGVDLTQQYNIPIKNIFMINTETPSQDPSLFGLGTISKLVIFTDEEIDG